MPGKSGRVFQMSNRRLLLILIKRPGERPKMSSNSEYSKFFAPFGNHTLILIIWTSNSFLIGCIAQCPFAIPSFPSLNIILGLTKKIVFRVTRPTHPENPRPKKFYETFRQKVVLRDFFANMTGIFIVTSFISQASIFLYSYCIINIICKV